MYVQTWSHKTSQPLEEVPDEITDFLFGKCLPDSEGSWGPVVSLQLKSIYISFCNIFSLDKLLSYLRKSSLVQNERLAQPSNSFGLGTVDDRDRVELFFLPS